jgi:hypothetical protein
MAPNTLLLLHAQALMKIHQMFPQAQLTSIYHYDAAIACTKENASHTITEIRVGDDVLLV